MAALPAGSFLVVPTTFAVSPRLASFADVTRLVRSSEHMKAEQKQTVPVLQKTCTSKFRHLRRVCSIGTCKLIMRYTCLSRFHCIFEQLLPRAQASVSCPAQREAVSLGIMHP